MRRLAECTGCEGFGLYLKSGGRYRDYRCWEFPPLPAGWDNVYGKLGCKRSCEQMRLELK